MLNGLALYQENNYVLGENKVINFTISRIINVKNQPVLADTLPIRFLTISPALFWLPLKYHTC